jgi:hypothetical protein
LPVVEVIRKTAELLAHAQIVPDSQPN